jgi:hypothetical protein
VLFRGFFLICRLTQEKRSTKPNESGSRFGSLFQYVSFDYLWWVLIAWLVVRLADTDDPQWWVPIGVPLGLLLYFNEKITIDLLIEFPSQIRCVCLEDAVLFKSRRAIFHIGVNPAEIKSS